jgi:perosamine synthetase
MKPDKFLKAFPPLDKRLLLSRRVKEDPILGAPNLYFYSSARAALFYLTRLLHLQKPDSVLLPAYNCGVEVEAVLRAGGAVTFYDITKDLSANYDSLLKGIHSNTRAIVIAHYFGFPQEMHVVENICKDKNIFLIEDCAHSLYSKNMDGEWLGMRGDFAIFSMRKTFFLPNGGALLINKKKDSLIPSTGKKYFRKSLLKTTLRSLLEYEQLKAGFLSGFCGNILSHHEDKIPLADVITSDHREEDNRGYYDEPIFDYENDISGLSRFLMAKEDYKSIISLRRRNYLSVQGKLSSLPSSSFVYPDLPEGVCPLSFPIFVQNRDQIVSRMLNNRIDPFVFARLPHPNTNISSFDSSKYLSDHLITLPIHQHLAETDIERIVNVFLASLNS